MDDKMTRRYFLKGGAPRPKAFNLALPWQAAIVPFGAQCPSTGASPTPPM